MVLQRPSSVSMPATCAAAVVVSASIRLTPAASTEPRWLRRCCMPRCAPTSADEHAVSTLTCHNKFLSGALIHFLVAKITAQAYFQLLRRLVHGWMTFGLGGLHCDLCRNNKLDLHSDPVACKHSKPYSNIARSLKSGS